VVNRLGTALLAVSGHIIVFVVYRAEHSTPDEGGFGGRGLGSIPKNN
jgi:hypothetical protein